MKRKPLDVPMESRMRWKSQAGSADGGTETTGRKAGTGASPPIQHAASHQRRAPNPWRSVRVVRS
jgi:hypothetical protein